jgi:hypothetical protein
MIELYATKAQHMHISKNDSIAKTRINILDCPTITLG